METEKGRRDVHDNIGELDTMLTYTALTAGPVPSSLSYPSPFLPLPLTLSKINTKTIKPKQKYSPKYNEIKGP